ncbi:hypothetical protein ACN20G_29795 (plasmid) [Streptomyces sp. BI20]|uniref:hypothetical protein n=1 Tax=Streptomyces sp. BI20 TaxID=3403460 RepID=UPI003C7759B8
MTETVYLTANIFDNLTMDDLRIAEAEASEEWAEVGRATSLHGDVVRLWDYLPSQDYAVSVEFRQEGEAVWDQQFLTPEGAVRRFTRVANRFLESLQAA